MQYHIYGDDVYCCELLNEHSHNTTQHNTTYHNITQHKNILRNTTL